MKPNCTPTRFPCPTSGERPGFRSSNSVGSFGYTAPSNRPNVRKFCFIQGCRNTSMRFPNLFFFQVPTTDVEAKTKWLTIAKREEHINNRIARWHCCEEHFDVEDIENYEQYKQKNAIPILKKDVVPHKLPSNLAPSLPVPKRRISINKDSRVVNAETSAGCMEQEKRATPDIENEDIITDKANLEEWDKFKRRLIRIVSRLLFKEKKPDDEVFAFLKKETGCDCLLLWDRMRSLTVKKMSRLLLADDKSANIPTVARMSLTDWLMCDLVIVHEDIDVLGRCDELSKPMTRDYHALIELFSLVQKFNVEELEGESLALSWSAAAKHYNTKGRKCSAMLLQRRWYQLKEWTRVHFYEFWQSYRGNRPRFEQTKDSMPGTLQRAVARRFPRVITDRFCEWEQLITWEKVILPEHFEALAHRELPTPCQDDDPDLIILEEPIETINVDSDDDSSSKEISTDDAATNFEINEATEMEDCGYDPNKVKSEPITEIDIEEHEIDKNALLLDSTRRALEEIDQAFSETGITSEIHVDEAEETNEVQAVETIRDQPVRDVLNNEEEEIYINTNNESIDNFDETAQSGFEIKLPKITNVYGNIADKELSNLSAKSAIQDENITNIDDDDDEDVIEDIIKLKLDGSVEASKTKVDETANMDKECLDTIEDKVVNVEISSNEVEIIKDEIIDLNETVDEVNFIDEGIAFLDDGIEEDEVVIIKSDPEETKHDEIEDTPKFDLKLLMEPVVYTTKLDQMQILRNTNFTTVKIEPIMENILKIESKPVSKRSLSYKQELKKEEDTNQLEVEIENPDSDDSKDLIKKELEEVQEIEIDSEIDINIQRIKPTSHLLQKPKNREYTPIQICKNPDFNTRLKRLNMGFYNHERNIQYLNMCQPLTIDLHKAFESKLIEGTLYLKPSEDIDNKPPKEDEDLNETVNINIVPFAGPVQSLMNVPKPTAEELLAVSSSVTSPAVDAHDDVVQVSRLNSAIPQPCLLAARTTSPSKQFYNKQFNEIAKLPTRAIRGRPPQKPHEYIDKRFKHKEKLIITRPKNPVSQPKWFSNKVKNKALKLDEFLIQPDTLSKMLMLMNGNDHGYTETKTKNERKKANKLFKTTIEKPCPQVVKTVQTVSEDIQVQEKTNNVISDVTMPSSPSKSIEVEVAPANINEDALTKENEIDKVGKSIETQTEEVLDVEKFYNQPSDSEIDEKTKKTCKTKISSRKYCCWARRKLANIGKKHYIKHHCPLDMCTCCCMKEFQNKMAEYRDGKIGDYKTKMQVEMQKQKQTSSLSVPATVKSTSNKPVAHIRIVPKPSTQESVIVNKLDDIESKAKKTRPSIVIDGTNANMLIGKSTTNSSPIYIGDNKILLTTMALPAHLDRVNRTQKAPSVKIVPNTKLPPGVQLVLLPNGRVTFTLDSNTNLTQDQIDRIPKILAAVQDQLNASDPTHLPKKIKKKYNYINTSDEIVISDDDEQDGTPPSVNTSTQINQYNMDSDSMLSNKSEQNSSQDPNTDNVNENTVSNRNTLLSDLMQMSGISFEDTVSQDQPPVADEDQVTSENITPQSLNSSLMVDDSKAGISADRVTPASTYNLESAAFTVDEVPKILNVSTDDVTESIIASNKIQENFPKVTGTIAPAVSVYTDTMAPEILVSTDDNASIDLVTTDTITSEVSVSAKDIDPVDTISIDDIASPVSVSTNAIAPEVSVSTDDIVPVFPISTDVIENAINKDILQINSMPLDDKIAALSDSFSNSVAYRVTARNPNIIHPNLSEFTVIKSFTQIKYVVENDGTFFKLDLETGIAAPINVSLKKKIGISFASKSPSKLKKPKIATIEMEEIDLTKDDIPQYIIPKDSFKNMGLPCNIPKPQYLKLAPREKLFNSEQPRPLKLIRSVQPRILRKRMNTSLLRPDDIFVVKQKRKQRLMARIISGTTTPNRPLNIEILDSDEDNTAPSQPEVPKPSASHKSIESDSSDDEPLSKISKKIHYPDDKSKDDNNSKIAVDSVSKSKIVDGDNDLPTNKDMDEPQDNRVPQLNLNEDSIITISPMEVDLVEPSPSIHLQNEPQPKSLLQSEQCFIPCAMPQYNDSESATDESSDNCILGV